MSSIAEPILWQPHWRFAIPLEYEIVHPTSGQAIVSGQEIGSTQSTDYRRVYAVLQLKAINGEVTSKAR
jgi:hypothetical protein